MRDASDAIKLLQAGPLGDLNGNGMSDFLEIQENFKTTRDGFEAKLARRFSELLNKIETLEQQYPTLKHDNLELIKDKNFQMLPDYEQHKDSYDMDKPLKDLAAKMYSCDRITDLGMQGASRHFGLEALYLKWEHMMSEDRGNQPGREAVFQYFRELSMIQMISQQLSCYDAVSPEMEGQQEMQCGALSSCLIATEPCSEIRQWFIEAISNTSEKKEVDAIVANRITDREAFVREIMDVVTKGIGVPSNHASQAPDARFYGYPWATIYKRADGRTLVQVPLDPKEGMPNPLVEAHLCLHQIEDAACDLVNNDPIKQATISSLASECSKRLHNADLQNAAMPFKARVKTSKLIVQDFLTQARYVSQHTKKQIDERARQIRDKRNDIIVGTRDKEDKTTEFVILTPENYLTKDQETLTGTGLDDLVTRTSSIEALGSGPMNTGSHQVNYPTGLRSAKRVIAGEYKPTTGVKITSDDFMHGSLLAYGSFKGDKYEEWAARAGLALTTEQRIEQDAQALVSQGDKLNNGVSNLYVQVVDPWRSIGETERQQFEEVGELLRVYDGQNIPLRIQKTGSSELAEITVPYHSYHCDFGVKATRWITTEQQRAQNAAFMNLISADVIKSIPENSGDFLKKFLKPSLSDGNQDEKTLKLIKEKQEACKDLHAQYIVTLKNYMEGYKASKDSPDGMAILDSRIAELNQLKNDITSKHDEIDKLHSSWDAARKKGWKANYVSIQAALKTYQKEVKTQIGVLTGEGEKQELRSQYNKAAYLCDVLNLYYTGAWKEPQNNYRLQALCKCLGTELGMIASSGCKSNNDRGPEVEKFNLALRKMVEGSNDGLYDLNMWDDPQQVAQFDKYRNALYLPFTTHVEQNNGVTTSKPHATNAAPNVNEGGRSAITKTFGKIGDIGKESSWKGWPIGNLVGGFLLAGLGVTLSLTGIGAVIGVPLFLIGCSISAGALGTIAYNSRKITSHKNKCEQEAAEAEAEAEAEVEAITGELYAVQEKEVWLQTSSDDALLTILSKLATEVCEKLRDPVFMALTSAQKNKAIENMIDLFEKNLCNAEIYTRDPEDRAALLSALITPILQHRINPAPLPGIHTKSTKHGEVHFAEESTSPLRVRTVDQALVNLEHKLRANLEPVGNEDIATQTDACFHHLFADLKKAITEQASEAKINDCYKQFIAEMKQIRQQPEDAAFFMPCSDDDDIINQPLGRKDNHPLVFFKADLRKDNLWKPNESVVVPQSVVQQDVVQQEVVQQDLMPQSVVQEDIGNISLLQAAKHFLGLGVSASTADPDIIRRDDVFDFRNEVEAKDIPLEAKPLYVEERKENEVEDKSAFTQNSRSELNSIASMTQRFTQYLKGRSSLTTSNIFKNTRASESALTNEDRQWMQESRERSSESSLSNCRSGLFYGLQNNPILGAYSTEVKQTELSKGAQPIKPM